MASAWARSGELLVHCSGLAVECDSSLGWGVTDDTFEAWSLSESAQGVSVFEQRVFLAQLVSEAALWSRSNPV